MKLYNFGASPNAIKVWAVIHKTGLQVESVTVEPGKTTQTDEYGAMNPNRMMPVLVDGDFTLWESNAIMQYLAQKAGDTGLWPIEPKAQADVSRWLCWQLAHWQLPVRGFMFENVVKKMFNRGEPDQAKLAEATEQFHQVARVLDGHLKDREWVATGQVTIADFALASAQGYAALAKMPLDDYANIKAWYSRLEAQDYWRKALPPVPSRA